MRRIDDARTRQIDHCIAGRHLLLPWSGLRRVARDHPHPGIVPRVAPRPRDHDALVAPRDQGADEMGSDEACATRDENAHA
jgi:hypothetical protein